MLINQIEILKCLFIWAQHIMNEFDFNRIQSHQGEIHKKNFLIDADLNKLLNSKLSLIFVSRNRNSYRCQMK